MSYENNERKMDSVYSKRIKAGKRRTYFFDVRATRGNDYFLTITESRKRFNEETYERHKIFLYKEDFNKFLKGLEEVVEHVKTDLMPDFDFDAFNHEYPEGEPPMEVSKNELNGNGVNHEEVAENMVVNSPDSLPLAAEAPVSTHEKITLEEVDKW